MRTHETIVGWLHVAAGAFAFGCIALLQRQAWPRTALLTIGALQLVAFPIGTALGAYTFWALLHTPDTATAPGASA